MLRLSVASDFEEVVLTSRLAFSKRSWPYVLAMTIPWILCAGQRSITRLADLGQHRRSLSSYYRFLSDGKWRLDELYRSLLALIVQTFGLSELTLVLDDTLCPKWGRRIFGTGNYFDHGNRPRPGYMWGHNWVVLAVVVQVGGVAWTALPVWIGLYRTKDSCPPEKFRTRHELAVEGLWRVRAWFSGPIRLLADGAYATDSLVSPLETMKVHLVSRLRKDARLRHVEPPPRRTGKRGRPPKHGAWMSRLGSMAKKSALFTPAEVTMYGKQVTLELHEFIAWWPPIGKAIKVVITRDPKNASRTAFLWTTDINMSAQAVVEDFAKRWSIEQMFSVAKQQLGFNSAEVRKERSVRRHAALCMAIITWVEVWVRRRGGKIQERTFTAKISALREETVKQTIFASGPRSEEVRQIARDMAMVVTVATQAA